MLLFRDFVHKLTSYEDDCTGAVKGNPKVVEVRLGLRTMNYACLGARHWSVLLKLSNDQWACIQFHITGMITADIFDCEEDAVLYTSPRAYHKVRTSIYGSTTQSLYWSDVVNWIEMEQGKHYMLGFRDCQNFARKMVRWLTGRRIGVWPTENGKIFYPETFDEDEKLLVILDRIVLMVVPVKEMIKDGKQSASALHTMVPLVVPEKQMLRG
ncbi:unnamed protein product [Adineta ricciae]|uniref:Uncharacterized protein n=1 Tax=Adineta ricciae TaxID=249248 RepID=A0A815BM51_ADIRI|nr:unnamed protein product [Adineta ricciae]CAF1663646.1 unnamed protein product [Adineta ricciae]